MKLLGVSNHGFVSILSEILNLLTNCETTILSYSPRISHYTVTIVLHLTSIHLSSYSNSGVFSTLGFCIGLRLSDCCTLESHLLFSQQPVNTLPSCIRISPLYHPSNSKLTNLPTGIHNALAVSQSIIVLLSTFLLPNWTP